MKLFGPQFFFLLLVLAAAITLACGSSPSEHTLQSVTLTPASADASSYPGGGVPFTATGNYSTAPSPVTPIAVTWGACDQAGNSTSEVSVSASGLAQCASGAIGTYTVWAFGSNPSRGTCGAMNACGGGCGRITGTAHLTCP